MRVPWLADVLRAEGLTVHEVDGWKGRGKNLSSVAGVVFHHTATGPRTSDAAVARLLRVGRSDLAGPLSQLGLDRKGGWWVIADGRANHNGYGTWGNASLGVEAFNDGVGEPWPAVQVESYVNGTAAILRRLGKTERDVKGHKETDPRRKIDPRGLDMNEMRGRVSAALLGEDDELMGKADDIIENQWNEAKVDKDRHERTEELLNQTLRGIVWFMRHQEISDTEIKRVLGKKELPPKAPSQ